MKNKTALGYYLIWIAVHLFILFVVSDGIFEKQLYNDFFPFNDVIEYDGDKYYTEVVYPPEWSDDKIPGNLYDSIMWQRERDKLKSRYIVEKDNPNYGLHIKLIKPMRDYDITEFLFYMIMPILLFFAIKLIRPQPAEPPKEN